MWHQGREQTLAQECQDSGKEGALAVVTQMVTGELKFPGLPLSCPNKDGRWLSQPLTSLSFLGMDVVHDPEPER